MEKNFTMVSIELPLVVQTVENTSINAGDPLLSLGVRYPEKVHSEQA